MTSVAFPDEEIKKRVKIALDLLFAKDSFLLDNNIHENSIAHKLAEYLQIVFPDWNVDFDYNKDVYDDALKREPGVQSESHTEVIRPDIIIHKRGTHEHLLVIEIKPFEESDALVISKLKELTSNSGRHKYKLGLFIGFNSLEDPTRKWFENGEETVR